MKCIWLRQFRLYVLARMLRRSRTNLKLIENSLCLSSRKWWNNSRLRLLKKMSGLRSLRIMWKTSFMPNCPNTIRKKSHNHKAQRCKCRSSKTQHNSNHKTKPNKTTKPTKTTSLTWCQNNPNKTPPQTQTPKLSPTPTTTTNTWPVSNQNWKHLNKSYNWNSINIISWRRSLRRSRNIWRLSWRKILCSRKRKRISRIGCFFSSRTLSLSGLRPVGWFLGKFKIFVLNVISKAAHAPKESNKLFKKKAKKFFNYLMESPLKITGKSKKNKFKDNWKKLQNQGLYKLKPPKGIKSSKTKNWSCYKKN